MDIYCTKICKELAENNTVYGFIGDIQNLPNMVLRLSGYDLHRVYDSLRKSDYDKVYNGSMVFYVVRLD